MKKSRHFHGKKTLKVQSTVNNTKVDEKELPNQISLEDENQGFGGWLRSPDGLENMKLFVIANSIVILTTFVYPQIQVVLDIISETIYGTDSEY